MVPSGSADHVLPRGRERRSGGAIRAQSALLGRLYPGVPIGSPEPKISPRGRVVGLRSSITPLLRPGPPGSPNKLFGRCVPEDYPGPQTDGTTAPWIWPKGSMQTVLRPAGDAVARAPVLRAGLVLPPEGEEHALVPVEDRRPQAVIGQRPHDRSPELTVPPVLPRVELLHASRHGEEPELVAGQEEVVVGPEVDREAREGPAVDVLEGRGQLRPPSHTVAPQRERHRLHRVEPLLLEALRSTPQRRLERPDEVTNPRDGVGPAGPRVGV